jgi:hypothetical protein
MAKLPLDKEIPIAKLLRKTEPIEDEDEYEYENDKTPYDNEPGSRPQRQRDQLQGMATRSCSSLFDE